MKISLLFVVLAIIVSSYGHKQHMAYPHVSSTSNSGEFDLEDTTYFTLVKDYIKQNGETREENASSALGKELIIKYYFLNMAEMEVSIDHSDRIYMNLEKEHYGNILKENGKVKPEIVYGIPDTNPTLTKQKENKVLSVYRELIVRALRK